MSSVRQKRQKRAGANIRAWRLKRKLTQDVFAEALDCIGWPSTLDRVAFGFQPAPRDCPLLRSTHTFNCDLVLGNKAVRHGLCGAAFASDADIN